jgi:hypothetical protein
MGCAQVQHRSPEERVWTGRTLIHRMRKGMTRMGRTYADKMRVADRMQKGMTRPNITQTGKIFGVYQQLGVILFRMVLPQLRLLAIIVNYTDYPSLIGAISPIFLNGDFGACDALFFSTSWFRIIPSHEDTLETLSTGLEVAFLGTSFRRHAASKVMIGLDDKILSRLIQLFIYDSFSADGFLHLFASHLPHLESITVGDDLNPSALIKSPLTRSQHQLDSSTGIPFPKLTMLTFLDGIQWDQESWELLMNFFRQRRDYGAPIQKLQCPKKKGHWPDSGGLASLN